MCYWKYVAFLGQPYQIDVKSADQFELLLTEAFQRDSSEAKQMMEDIGNEVDLYSLADEMVETEDLLENEDDAPIIKLINAMLSEAIKENASDIHIETFRTSLTNTLSYRWRVARSTKAKSQTSIIISFAYQGYGEVGYC